MPDKVLDGLLIAASLALGALIALIATQLLGVEFFARDTVLVAATGITTILGAALGASIAVNGALRAAQRQVELQRQHELQDREQSKYIRYSTASMRLIPVFYAIRDFATSEVTSNNFNDADTVSRKLADDIDSAFHLPFDLGAQDAAYHFWPQAHQAMRELTATLRDRPGAYSIDEGLRMISKFQEKAAECGNKLHLFLRHLMDEHYQNVGDDYSALLTQAFPPIIRPVARRQH